MKEQIISFKTAKLAKKKGYHITPRYGNEASLYSKSGEHVYYTNYGFMGSGLNDGYIPAPTQSLLQKWLREEHGMDLWFGECNPPNRYHVEDIVTKDGIVGGVKKGSSTYEEALEEGLVAALKFIK